MTEPELDARKHNTRTTAALRFDNRLDSCNHPQPRGRNGRDDGRLHTRDAFQRSSSSGGGLS